ncbi:MAG TPA: hypothetical protein VMY76_12530 [Gemmatimonadales bacterium]|nr:hypothetical protein [Gemmatimonadales bacterium]
MARNLSREFATMTDEERQRFALERGDASDGGVTEPAADELVFDDPRNPDHMGSHPAGDADGSADPEARDGAAAQLDDEAHARNVREQGKRRTR